MFALLAASRFFHYAAICALFGLAAFPVYAPWPGSSSVAFRRALRWSAVLALVTGVLVLGLMSANMGNGLASALDPQVLSAVVGDTDFGRVWVIRLAVAVAGLALALGPNPARSRALFVVSGLLLTSVALTGHSAIPSGALGWLHRLADATHLLAAGWWIGGLLALALAARRLGPGAVQVLERFSGIGYGAVAAIVLTGLVKSAILLASWEGAFLTPYGWTLGVKIALFAGMGVLALSNRFWITPALRGSAAPDVWLQRLRRHVIVEFALGLGVLAVVGALGAMSPPASG